MSLYKRSAFTSRWTELYQGMHKSIADDMADIILHFGRELSFYNWMQLGEWIQADAGSEIKKVMREAKKKTS